MRLIALTAAISAVLLLPLSLLLAISSTIGLALTVSSAIGLATAMLTALTLRLTGRRVVGTTSEQLEVVSQYLYRVPFDSLLICPFTAAQTSFYVHLRPLVHETVGHIGEIAPQHHIVPFGMIARLLRLTAVYPFCRSYPQTRHFHTALERPYFRVSPDISYQNNLVNHIFFIFAASRPVSRSAVTTLQLFEHAYKQTRHLLFRPLALFLHLFMRH